MARDGHHVANQIICHRLKQEPDLLVLFTIHGMYRLTADYDPFAHSASIDF